MKLFLDSHREPEPTWVWAKTAHCAITFLRGGNVDLISFAPDQAKTVEEVTTWMIENCVHPQRATHLATVKPRRKMLQALIEKVS